MIRWLKKLYCGDRLRELGFSLERDLEPFQCLKGATKKLERVWSGGARGIWLQIERGCAYIWF